MSKIMDVVIDEMNRLRELECEDCGCDKEIESEEDVLELINIENDKV